MKKLMFASCVFMCCFSLSDAECTCGKCTLKSAAPDCNGIIVNTLHVVLLYPSSIARKEDAEIIKQITDCLNNECKISIPKEYMYSMVHTIHERYSFSYIINIALNPDRDESQFAQRLYPDPVPGVVNLGPFMFTYKGGASNVTGISQPELLSAFFTLNNLKFDGCTTNTIFNHITKSEPAVISLQIFLKPEQSAL